MPPAAPTMPVAAPVAAGNSWGTALNTAPFPRPRNTASVRHAIVTGTMVGSPQMTASAAASTPTSRKTTASTVAAPTRSESIPPTGRASVASTVKPAARRPASVQGEVEPVLEQLRQEHRHRDKPPERDEVEQREAPQPPAGAKHLGVAHGRAAGWLDGVAVEDECRRDEECRGDDPERLATEQVDDRGRTEGSDGGADVAHPVDAEREALPLPPVPPCDEGNAHRADAPAIPRKNPTTMRAA